MAVGDRKDPYISFRFLVEIDGVMAGGFSEVSGLQAEIEVKDYREGGWNAYIYKLAGPVRYPSNLILKHGLTDDTELWEWYEQAMQGEIVRKTLSVVLLDMKGDEQRRWDFEGVYPVKWVGPELRAGTAQVAIETLELVHGQPQYRPIRN